MGTLIAVGFGVVLVAMLWHALSAKPTPPRAAPRPMPTERRRVIRPLGRAIVERDLESLEGLLRSGSDPNEAALDDMPPLLVAALEDVSEAVGPLLAAGADIDHADARLGTALTTALAKQHEEVVEQLLAANASLEPVGEGGATALHIAAMIGPLERVQRLVERGAAIDPLNRQGGTPLRSAAASGQTDIVAWLLAQGADPAPRDAFDKLPVDYARKAESPSIVALLEGKPESPPRRPPREPLRWQLPPRQDATLRAIESSLERGWTTAQAACTALEAPSLLLAIRRLPGYEAFEIETTGIDEPDPREPTRSMARVLWRYDGLEPEPALEPPSAGVAQEVSALAIRPFGLAAWSERARARVRGLGPSDDRELLACMVHPGAAPPYLMPWDWAFRTQVAAALLLSALEDGEWRSSNRRTALCDVLDGPVDWACTAAIVALYDVARREPSCRRDVEALLLAAARRPVGPSAYQHVIEPACQALIELGVTGAVEREVRSRLDPDE